MAIGSDFINCEIQTGVALNWKSVLHPLKSICYLCCCLFQSICLLISVVLLRISFLSPNVVERKKYKPKHVWNTDTSTYFIDMCLNEKLKGNKPGSHLNLPDFQRAQTPALRAPSGAKETFNFRHSSLRNIIERTFGVWKARWAILRDMHVNFTYDHQVKIVLASMAMRNYIRKAGILDETFNTAQQESYDPTPCPNTPCPNTNGAQEGPSRRPTSNEDSLWMAAYRDMIAEEIMNT
ncbi:hypothetical protein LXL04_020189 [Taraxacum kok-saghyz]